METGSEDLIDLCDAMIGCMSHKDVVLLLNSLKKNYSGKSFQINHFIDTLDHKLDFYQSWNEDQDHHDHRPA